MFLTTHVIRTIELDTSTISLIEGDIIWVDYRSDVDIDGSNVKEVGKAILELCNGEAHYFVVDVRNCFGTYTQEAREYMAKNPEINKVRKALAFLTNSLGTRILANFYLNFNKPLSPGKLFSDEIKALAWLESLKNSN